MRILNAKNLSNQGFASEIHFLTLSTYLLFHEFIRTFTPCYSRRLCFLSQTHRQAGRSYSALEFTLLPFPIGISSQNNLVHVNRSVRAPGQKSRGWMMMRSAKDGNRDMIQLCDGATPDDLMQMTALRLSKLHA